jgi:GT2 family glycosyltransferase
MKAGLTLGILVRNQPENIARCIQSIEWPKNLPVEVLIVDHCSNDNTVESARRACPRDIPLKIFQSSKNNLGLSRDFVLHTAQYSCLVFIDSDCQATPGWLQKIYDHFQATRSVKDRWIGVGGENLPPQTSGSFYRSLRIMFSSIIGNGNSPQAKEVREPESVNHLPTCNIALDVARAKDIGGFSGDYSFVSEDLEFSRRAQESGYRFLFLPQCSVWHWHEPSYFSWLNKMFRYGRGQILVQRRHQGHLLGPRIVPLLFVSALLVLALFAKKFFWPIGLAYVAFLLLYSLYLCVRAGEVFLVGSVFYLILGSHIFYGLGELFELFNIHSQIKHKKVNQEKPNDGFVLFEEGHENSQSPSLIQV